LGSILVLRPNDGWMAGAPNPSTLTLPRELT
jgi:hypothetical protein